MIINKGYINHNDPIFKSQNILKIVYILYIFFHHNFHHNLLPKSFTNYIPKTNLDESSRITRQHNLLAKQEIYKTHVSSKLPKHKFTQMWNSIGIDMHNIKRRLKFKHVLSKTNT